MLTLKTLALALTAITVVSVIAATYLPKSENLTATSDLQCVARSTMISKAQVWVDNHVPYSQTGSYQGYRTDCSGFVSMAWELAKPGLTTSTMHTVATNISKDSLEHGDALNCDSEHIVLFGGWTDSSKTHYIAYEETRPGEGTVKRATPYPYWSNPGCFHPIRFNHVC